MLKLAMLSVLATIPVVLGIAWLTTRFQYRITSKHLEVTLFGICVRRLALSDIRSMSARRLHRGERGEQWWNSLRPSRRFLTLRRRSGWLRYFVITPKHRYIFQAELKQAMAALKLPAPTVEEADPGDEDPDDAKDIAALQAAPPAQDANRE